MKMLGAVVPFVLSLGCFFAILTAGYWLADRYPDDGGWIMWLCVFSAIFGAIGIPSIAEEIRWRKTNDR